MPGPKVYFSFSAASPKFEINFEFSLVGEPHMNGGSHVNETICNGSVAAKHCMKLRQKKWWIAAATKRRWKLGSAERLRSWKRCWLRAWNRAWGDMRWWWIRPALHRPRRPCIHSQDPIPVWASEQDCHCLAPPKRALKMHKFQSKSEQLPKGPCKKLTFLDPGPVTLAKLPGSAKGVWLNWLWCVTPGIAMEEYIVLYNLCYFTDCAVSGKH